MFCSQCGAQVNDSASFCPQCGNPISVTRAQQAVQPAGAQPAPVQQARQHGQPGLSTVPVQHPYQQVGAVPASQLAARGCFGSGWDDVRASDGWFKKVALMALIGLVPILNWVNIGYGLNWSKDMARGNREGLPAKIVNGDNFKLGFFSTILTVILLAAMWLEGFVLGFVPIVGMLAAIVLGVFAQMFANLSYVRVALFGNLGAGFAVGKLFEGYKRKLGTLFCIAFVPGLIGVGISLIIWLAFALIAGVFAGADFLALASSAARYGSYGPLPPGLMYGMGGSIAIVLILALVALYLDMIAAQFCALAGQRAVGHYVARFVPEWVGEADGAAVRAASSVSADSAVPAPAQPAQPTAPAAVGVAPVPAPAAVAPRSAAPAEFTSADAPRPAGASAGPAVGGSGAFMPEPRSLAFDSDPYAIGETSVLPEMPEEMDTIVQPEGLVEPAYTVKRVPSGGAAQDAAAEAVVRLQPTVASGPLVGDNSDTMVLMEEAPSQQVMKAQPTAGQCALQVTRANGDTCVLSSFPTTIGKGSGADLVIEGNSAISRLHVRILRDGNVFAAEDLGSKNKTFIGSYQLPAHTPTILSDGDELRLGNEVLRVKIV